MRKPVRYHSIIADNARWEGSSLREGDIIISSPPKCGTTWTQVICALLIFRPPDLPRFFHRARHGEWRDILDAELSAWLQRGSICPA